MKPVPEGEGTRPGPSRYLVALLPTPTSLLTEKNLFFPFFETESHTFKAGFKLTREPKMTWNS